MFLFNLKINTNRFIKFIFIVLLVSILVIFGIAFYKTFFSSRNEALKLTDTVKGDDVFEITSQNYTTILQTVTNDLDSYIGCKVHFQGYVYRISDFEENKFVLARNMLVNSSNSQSLVVGFLCYSKDASNYSDGTWVDIVGSIAKGNYHGEIAQINVIQIKECDEPEDKFVSQPDDTYIPTSAIL